MSPTPDDYHKKMQEVWMKALDEVHGRDPQATAAYRLFLWLLDNGIMNPTTFSDLSGIRRELAMFQSNPLENWKAVKLEKECPSLWHCVSTLLQSFGTFHEMLGHQRQMFTHNTSTINWLDQLYATVREGYHEAWIEQGSRSSRLRYYIALDIFEYAANADIAHISKLVIENLEALEKIRIEHEKKRGEVS